MSSLLAAIDLGTNTALLHIARMAPDGRLETVEDLCRTPRLGSGLAKHGVLDREARERAFEVLGEYARRIEQLGVPPARVRAVGTACLRKARDGAAFAAEVRARLGLPLEVLSEEAEARLSALAARAAGVDARCVVVDVGGGSTEVACEELGLRWSRPIGAVVLTETYLGDEPLAPGGYAALEVEARRACATLPEGLARGREVVVVGGTGVNLACLHLGLSRFDPLAAESCRIPAEAAGRIGRVLAAESLQARRARPMEAERAEILPAGLACLAAALERLAAQTFRTTTKGLRHGLAHEIAHAFPDG
ncbi:MAG: hypothetical protein ACK57N_05460 [Planctomycetia bacterium]|jgi:exopolyphosphatase/guanosine-5'-triphosphate,3'-diphosphate pyrophosphatase